MVVGYNRAVGIGITCLSVSLSNIILRLPLRYEFFHAVVWRSLRMAKRVKYESAVTFLCKTRDGLVKQRSLGTHFAVNNSCRCSTPLYISQHDTATVHKALPSRQRIYFHISWKRTLVVFALIMLSVVETSILLVFPDVTSSFLINVYSAVVLISP